MISYYGPKEKCKYEVTVSPKSQETTAYNSLTKFEKTFYSKNNIIKLIQEDKLSFPFLVFTNDCSSYEKINNIKDISSLGDKKKYIITSSELYQHLTPFYILTNSKTTLHNNYWSLNIHEKLLNHPKLYPCTGILLKETKEKYSHAFLVTNNEIKKSNFTPFSRKEKHDLIYFAYLWLIHLTKELPNIDSLNEYCNYNITVGFIDGPITRFPGIVAEKIIKNIININKNTLENKFVNDFTNYLYQYFFSETSLNQFPKLSKEEVKDSKIFSAFSVEEIMNTYSYPIELNKKLYSYLNLNPKELFDSIYNQFSRKEKNIFKEELEKLKISNYTFSLEKEYSNVQFRFKDSQAILRVQGFPTSKNNISFKGKELLNEEVKNSNFETDIHVDFSERTRAKIVTLKASSLSHAGTKVSYIPGYIKNKNLYSVEKDILIFENFTSKIKQ